MKKVLFSLFFFCFSLCLNAQVSYGNATWGTYYMQINVVTENDSVFLNMTFTSEDRKITDHPKLLLRFMDDSLISLEGVNVSSVQKNEGGLIVHGLLLSSDYFISEAKFPISKEQISLFGKGVKKLRLNTSPKIHEKGWKRDKIGKKIYEAYLKCSPNSFVDGF